METSKISENPGELVRMAEAGELTLITDRSNPVSVNIPCSRDLLEQGYHVKMAAKLFEDGILTLVSAARVAQLRVESFLEKLAMLGLVAVDYEANDTTDELVWLDQFK